MPKRNIINKFVGNKQGDKKIHEILEKKVEIKSIKFKDNQIIINSTINHPSGGYKIVETTLYADKLSDVNKVFVDNIKSMSSSIVIEMDESKEEIKECKCKNCGCGKK